MAIENKMIRTVQLKQNYFLSIFSDAVILYEAALATDNEVLKNALVKSSILSVNYALEAAANSFLESVEITKYLKIKVDKFSTLDKFDFVLQWHTDHHLEKGDPDVQAVQNLINNRNSMVHPKVKTGDVTVETSIEAGKPIAHTVIKPVPKKGQDPKHKLLGDDPELYTEHDAKAALEVMTSFLNIFVEHWWGIDYKDSEMFLFQTWNGSIQARRCMFKEHEIRTLLRNDFLQIRFMGVDGMLENKQE